jgi:hypothetical protein
VAAAIGAAVTGVDPASLLVLLGPYNVSMIVRLYVDGFSGTVAELRTQVTASIISAASLLLEVPPEMISVTPVTQGRRSLRAISSVLSLVEVTRIKNASLAAVAGSRLALISFPRVKDAVVTSVTSTPPAFSVEVSVVFQMTASIDEIAAAGAAISAKGTAGAEVSDAIQNFPAFLGAPPPPPPLAVLAPRVAASFSNLNRAESTALFSAVVVTISVAALVCIAGTFFVVKRRFAKKRDSRSAKVHPVNEERRRAEEDTDRVRSEEWRA